MDADAGDMNRLWTAVGVPTFASVNNKSGIVVITLGGTGAAVDGDTGTFTLENVLVSVAGSGFSMLDANISVTSGSGYLITAGQNVARVVTAVVAGLDELDGNEARLFTDGTIADDMADFTITENFIDLFKDGSQFSGATDKGVTVVVEMIGIPDGLTFNCKPSPQPPI